MSTMPEPEHRLRRLMWGCTGGCLGLMIIIGLAIFIGYRILASPQPIPPPQAFVPADATGFLFVRIDPDQPMLINTCVRILLSAPAQEAGGEAFGPDFQTTREQVESLIVSTAPIQLVAFGSADPEGGPGSGGAVVSVWRWGFLVRMLWKAVTAEMVDQGATPGEHGDTRIVTLPDGGATGAWRGTLMVSDRESTVNEWAGNLTAWQDLAERAADEGTDAPVPRLDVEPALAAAYDRLDPDSPAAFALMNVEGAMDAFLDLMPEQAGDALRATGIGGDTVLSVSGQLQEQNNLDGVATAFLVCADDAAAEGLAERLAPVLEEFAAGARLRNLEVTAETGGVVRLSARVENVPDRAAYLIGAIVNGMEPAPDEDAPDESPEEAPAQIEPVAEPAQK